MKYQLGTQYLEERCFAEISKEFFDDLKTARKILSCAFAIEEKWNLVTFNFLELLNEQLRSAARNTVSRPVNYEDFYEVMTGFTVRLSNFLSTTLLYLHQANHSLPEELGLREIFKEAQTVHYNISPEYRFMYALRNYMQHRSVPIHQISHQNRWTSHSDPNAKMQSWTTLYAFKEQLAEDKEFKAKVLYEMPDRVDLIHYAKCYVEHLSAIHCQLRELLEEHIQAATRKFQQAQELYKSSGGKCKLDGLTAWHTANDTVIEKCLLLMKWEEVRQSMVLRNPELVNFSKTFVASEKPHRE